MGLFYFTEHLAAREETSGLCSQSMVVTYHTPSHLRRQNECGLGLNIADLCGRKQEEEWSLADGEVSLQPF